MTQMRTGMLASLALASALAAAPQSSKAPALPEGAAAADPKQQAKRCWDFDAMELLQKLSIGDSLTTRVAEISIGEYLSNGQLTSNPAATVYANNSKIAGSSNPELRTYLARARVKPNEPVSVVRFRFGFTGSAGGPHSNLGVNGDLREIDGSLTSLDGELLGEMPRGKARVKVTLDSGPGEPDSGVLELHAVAGSIQTFSFGGVQMFVDDVCMRK